MSAQNTTLSSCNRKKRRAKLKYEGYWYIKCTHCVRTEANMQQFFAKMQYSKNKYLFPSLASLNIHKYGSGIQLAMKIVYKLKKVFTKCSAITFSKSISYNFFWVFFKFKLLNPRKIQMFLRGFHVDYTDYSDVYYPNQRDMRQIL